MGQTFIIAIKKPTIRVKVRYYEKPQQNYAYLQEKVRILILKIDTIIDCADKKTQQEGRVVIKSITAR